MSRHDWNSCKKRAFYFFKKYSLGFWWIQVRIKLLYCPIALCKPYVRQNPEYLKICLMIDTALGMARFFNQQDFK